MIDYLTSCCELLIQNGHNSSYRNPYAYAIKDLIRLSNLIYERQKAELISKAVIEHTSRVAVAAGDQEIFNATIKKIQE